MSFQNLNLDASLLRAIEALGYTEATEIQQRAIPEVLAGKDVMASAQTGTGKTAAFVLPALQYLLAPMQSASRGPRVLILTPTRELAQQITEAIQQLGRFVRLNFGAVVGGVGYGPQENLLRKPLDILIATPGRLMDHMEKGRVDFSRLQLLVLDEADRMLDMGFIEDVELIASKTPKARQTLLFSATLEGQVQRVARTLLKDPVKIQISSVQARHDSIEQRIHHADDIKHKLALLEHMLSDKELWQTIVFTATKRGADQLAARLGEQGHQAAALHGDMKQSQRNRTVERLRRGKLRVLVATDVAARGLDIKGITHVINFDLPKVAEDYVHRIGRTGRGGASGIAMSLVGPDDWMHLKRIERLLGARFERSVIAGLEPTRAEPRFERRPPSGGRPHSSRNAAPRHHHSGQRDSSQRPARPSNGKPRGEHRPEFRSEQRPNGNRFDHRGGNRAEQRPAHRGDARPEFRPEHRPARRPDFSADARPAYRNDSQPAPRRESRPSITFTKKRGEPRLSRPEGKPRRDLAARDGSDPVRKPRAAFNG